MLSVRALRPLARSTRVSCVPKLLVTKLSTVNTSFNEEDQILVNQRKQRPISPDLTIYKPQFTWILSGLHRITGVFLAAGFYGITCTYAAGGLFDFNIDAASVLQTVQELPVAVKYAAKAAIAYPFAFHFFNGIRHFVWDSGKELNIKGIYRTAYVCLGLSAAFGTYLTFIS